MSEEIVVNDTYSISSECPSFTSEICHDTQENSPSFTEEQEVNKPLVDNLTEQSEFPSLFAELQAAVSSPDPLNINSYYIESENSPPVPSEETNGHIQQKPKRNVTFPNDSDLILGYLEPPDPWKDLPDWRTEDLLKAYKQSCDKHGTKPLNKVLQQLQCIENVGERYEILSLKGERLDLKQIESLEDIFRHVRFRCIDLEATHLDDEMAVAIFEMVEYYESACKLNISFNKNIGPRGWQSCSRLVRKTPCLTFIDARNCDLNERVVPFLGRALRMGCYLTRLHLQSANIAGRALIILVAALKMNETLKELSVGDNKFMPTDGVHLGNLLKYNHKLELLDLRNNHLQDAGATHIADGLAEQNLDGGLLTLVLWNNQITFHAMKAINKALTSCEYVETLNLGHNPLTNEGIHVLKDGLLKSKSLLKLGLSGTKVTCEGAVALAEVIADNNRLIRVDLQENDIKTAGLMALSLALKVNENLTRLDLDRETKKEAGVKDYVEQQKRLQQDISSILERNRDIARNREEEKRQIELKNEENARKLQEAASEVDLTQEEEESSQYIPSGDSVHRPKLLFLPQTSTVNNLDSPALGNDTFQSSPGGHENTALPLSIEGPDLLSPQYCPDPKITAKKIFSVSQVVSPSLPGHIGDYLHGAGSDVSCSVPVPQICMPLSSLELPSVSSSEDILTPNTLQKVVGEQTLESYIQDIIGDCNEDSVNSVKENKDATNEIAGGQIDSSGSEKIIDVSTNTGVSEPTGQVDDNNSLTKEQENVIESENVEEGESNSGWQCNDKPKDVITDKSVESDDYSYGASVDSEGENMIAKTVDTKNVNNSNGTELLDVQNIQNCDSKSVNIPDNENTKGIPEDHKSNTSSNSFLGGTVTSCDTDIHVHVTENDTINDVNTSLNSNKSSSQSDTIEKTVVDVQSDAKLSNLSVNSGANENNGFKSDTRPGEIDDVNSLSFETIENEADDSSDFQKVDSAIQHEISNTCADYEQKNSSARSSADLESWNAVSKSEISENDSLVLVSPPGSDDNGNTNKPDFFSSLTLNGLKQELASLIDDEVNHSSSTQSGVLSNGNQLSHEETNVTGERSDTWFEATDVLQEKDV